VNAERNIIAQRFAEHRLGSIKIIEAGRLHLKHIPYGQKIRTAEEPVLHRAIKLARAQSWGDG
jgi:hypothetical protein